MASGSRDGAASETCLDRRCLGEVTKTSGFESVAGSETWLDGQIGGGRIEPNWQSMGQKSAGSYIKSGVEERREGFGDVCWVF